MKKLLILLFFIFAGLGKPFSQQPPDNISTINAYWGQVVNFEVTADQIKQFNSIAVYDTIKQRKISAVQKFRFIIQPMLQGEAKMVESTGSALNPTMKSYLSNPQKGDKVIVSEIYATVENEGYRKIPTAIVLVVK